MYEHSFLDIYMKTKDEVLEVINKLIDELEIEYNDDKYDENSKKDIRNVINTTKTELNVVVDAYNTSLELITLDNVKRLINISKELKLPFKLYVSDGTKFNDDYTINVSMLFDDETIDRFIEINNYLVENNECELKFLEDYLNPNLAWSLEQIITANDSVNSIKNFIENNKLTPFEAVAFIHKIVISTFQYNESEEDSLFSRSLIGIMNTDYIVCVGFATFVKAVVDKLGLAGLSCETYTGFIEREDEHSELSEYMYFLSGEAHMQNLVKIADEKYGVYGAYVLDSCWDSKSKYFPSGKGFANFMYPVTDLLCLKNIKFVQHQNSLDDVLSQFIEYDEKSEDSPVIVDNKDNSNPINIDILTDCLYNLYKVIYTKADEEEIELRVERTIEVSKIVSKEMFNSNATNALRQEVLKDELMDLDI